MPCWRTYQIKHPIFLVKVVDIFAIESDTEHIFLELNNTFCFITSYFISEDYGSKRG